MNNPPTTRERVLTAASEIFAEKGYRDATVSEICEAADANIASVNYHFGDKESLYDEVWRHALRSRRAGEESERCEDQSGSNTVHSHLSRVMSRHVPGSAGVYARTLG